MTTRPRVDVATGALTGIGLTISDRFAADGWVVYRADRAAEFLCGTDASLVTGVSLSVDGGGAIR
ncbi:MAG: hypothetical protein ACRDS9_28485 [Pseudonocardiaceae bacterium]